MARYRAKDETDLAWNRIRRQITRDLDTEIANRREEILDGLLTGAWEEYTLALKSGTVIQVETKYRKLFREIVREAIPERELPSVDEG